MNTREFSKRIDDLRPMYDEKYRGMIEKLSQKGDSTGRGNVSTFGAFYQTYMYAYLIGLRLHEQCPIEKKGTDFAPIGKWNPVRLKDFIILTLLNRVEEFGYRWTDLETGDSAKMDIFFKRIQKEIEGYANRGLKYLQQKYDTEKIRFEDPNVFMNFLQELENNK